MWVLVMVLVRCENNDSRSRYYEKRWIGWFLIPMASIFIRNYYLQYTNFLNLSNKVSVNVSSIITALTLKKKGENQTVLVVTRLSSSLVLMTQPELAKWLR